MSKKIHQSDSITGNRITGQALKILPVQRNSKRDTTKLERDAYCVVEEQLLKRDHGKLPTGASISNEFEELQAFKVAAEADIIDEKELFRRSKNHRGQQVTMHGAAYCVIEQEMRWVQQTNR